MKRTKKQWKLYQKKIDKGIKRRNKIQKRFNIKRNNVKNNKSSRKNKYNELQRKTRHSFKLPKDFELLKNTEEVISFINNIVKLKEKGRNHEVFLDLRQITNIDIGAVSLLLAAVNLLYRYHVNTMGNYPLDKISQQFFKDSGFLDNVQTIQKRKSDEKRKNMMIEWGHSHTGNKEFSKEVRKAIKHLTGQEERYQPLFSMIQEMCANSIEHANLNIQDKNWLLSTSYLEKSVVFTMTDLGKGILGTLRKKISQNIRDLIDVKRNEVDVLNDAFDKKYQSNTGEKNRNKGLPRIKAMNSLGYVENLSVITNNVCLNFNNFSLSKRLNCNLKGTIYYWELNLNSIEKWKKRKI